MPTEPNQAKVPPLRAIPPVPADLSPPPAAGNLLPFLAKVARSFRFAFAGLRYLFRTQRNARVHACIGIAACAVAAWLRISPVGWALLIFTIALVLILEGLNTAIEAAIDLAMPDVHPLAKAAKDLAAGMVLLAAMASVAVGLLILGPPLWHKFFGG